MNGAVGLPAYTKNSAGSPLESQLGRLEGMEDLGGGISTKIADAVGAKIHSSGKIRSGYPAGGKCLFPEMIVLAVQTVEGAGLIKNGQIPISILRPGRNCIPRIAASGSTGTHKIAHTVGGKGI
jgi:hypothetical protein